MHVVDSQLLERDSFGKDTSPLLGLLGILLLWSRGTGEVAASHGSSIGNDRTLGVQVINSLRFESLDVGEDKGMLFGLIFFIPFFGMALSALSR